MSAVNESTKYTHFSNVEIGSTGGSGALKINGTAVTATAAEINNVADGSGSYVKVTDAATYSILAANSGKLHVMPDLTADCVLSLPTAADGLRFRFIYSGTAADAHDWQIDAGSDTNFYLGGVTQFDGGTNLFDSVFPDGDSNSIVNFLTPSTGTDVEFLCDGTNWFIHGQLMSDTDTGVTFADQS